MQAAEGKRVTIRFVCRSEDGTLYELGQRDTLRFIIGQGDTLPTLEKGVVGMKPGERRIVRVPMTEVDEFSFYEENAPADIALPAGGTDGRSAQYNIAPGEEGDVTTAPSPSPLRVKEGIHPVEAGIEELYFEIEMLEVVDAELELGA